MLKLGSFSLGVFKWTLGVGVALGLIATFSSARDAASIGGAAVDIVGTGTGIVIGQVDEIAPAVRKGIEADESSSTVPDTASRN